MSSEEFSDLEKNVEICPLRAVQPIQPGNNSPLKIKIAVSHTFF
jgi:hypothetical protein